MALFPELRIDGNFGPVTRKAFQILLTKRGSYTGLIDGDFGPMSIRALQRHLRAHNGALIIYNGAIDGIAGNMTWDGLGTLISWQGYWRSKPWPWPSGQTAYNWSGFTRQIQIWLNAMR